MSALNSTLPTRFLGGYVDYDYPGEREWLIEVCQIMNAWAIRSTESFSQDLN